MCRTIKSWTNQKNISIKFNGLTPRKFNKLAYGIAQILLKILGVKAFTYLNELLNVAGKSLDILNNKLTNWSHNSNYEDSNLLSPILFSPHCKTNGRTVLQELTEQLQPADNQQGFRKNNNDFTENLPPHSEGTQYPNNTHERTIMGALESLRPRLSWNFTPSIEKPSLSPFLKRWGANYRQSR